MSIDAKRFIYMGNSNKAPIEVIGLFRLQLEYGCYLDWMRLFMYYHLDRIWYLFLIWTNQATLIHLEMKKMSLFQYSNMIGIGSLVDNLYKLDINVSHINESLHASNCGTKCKLTYENSFLL